VVAYQKVPCPPSSGAGRRAIGPSKAQNLQRSAVDASIAVVAVNGLDDKVEATPGGLGVRVRQLVESVRPWVRHADIDDGIPDGLTTAEPPTVASLQSTDALRNRLMPGVLRILRLTPIRDSFPWPHPRIRCEPPRVS
jgi:hypothetical protein